MSESKKLPIEYAIELTKLVASDRGGRGVSRLCRPELWQRAAENFADKRRVAVASGFYVPEAEAAETDGPGGAVLLARAFLSRGADSVLWTDEYCLPVMKQCAAVAGFPEERVVVPHMAREVELYEPDGVIFTERLGRAADGYYYNIRKKNISNWTWPLDNLAITCLNKNIPTIGIGDGGNEVGMGSFMVELPELLPDYKKCLSVVRATTVLPADVSNWGAYALVAALSNLWGEWMGHRPGEERAMLEALKDAGAVDGISLKAELSVDGFQIAEHEAIARSLCELWSRFQK